MVATPQRSPICFKPRCIFNLWAIYLDAQPVPSLTEATHASLPFRYIKQSAKEYLLRGQGHCANKVVVAMEATLQNRPN
jgi:hypothetical protein